MTTLLIILIAAAASFALATLLRLPTIPVLMAAGLLLGATSTFFASDAHAAHAFDAALLERMLELGLMFLVFAAGLELNPARVMRRRQAALSIGLIQFFTLFAAGTAATLVFGYAPLTALHLGLAVAGSSTILVVRILQKRRQFFEPFGRLVLGVLLLQDLLVIFLLAGISGAASGLPGVAASIGATLALVALTWLSARWIAPLLIIRMELDQDSLLIVALAILFGFAGLAHWMHLHPAIGCFLAGVSLSGFPVNGVVRGQLQSLNQFFLSLFFVCLGAVLTLPTLRETLLIAVLVLLIVIITPLLVLIVAERFGISTRASIESGLLLAQSSELSIIVAIIGLRSGALDHAMLSAISLVAIITMVSTSFVATDRMTWRLLRLRPTRSQPVTLSDARDHIVMLGCGSNSQILLDLLLLEGHRVVVADEDPGVIARLRARGVDALRGDGADPSVLDALSARHARVIISTMRRIADNERLIARVQGPLVFVRVFGQTDASRIERAGGVAIREDQAGSDDFMTWFIDRFQRAADPIDASVQKP